MFMESPMSSPATSSDATDAPAAAATCDKAQMPQRYLLITPCRDEAEYIERTIKSVGAQSVVPTKWIIVDDGSTDDTPRILADAAAKFPFIEIVNRKDRGRRKVGPGVIEAFYAGLDTIDLADFDYVCKFDGDLILPPRYFEILMTKMEADPQIGNLSGKTYIRTASDRLVSERMGDENAIGPSKFYRVACFEDIGGFVHEISWDGIDGHQCRRKGWIASSIDEPDLVIEHLRPQGSSEQGIWTGRMRWGRGKYFMGSSITYVLAVSMYRAFERPFFIGGFGILCGYLMATFRKLPRYNDREYRKFFRRYEFRSLFFGKRRTLDRYNDAIRSTRAVGPDHCNSNATGSTS